MHRTYTHDVLVVGGGPAGLTAALYLGRARKSVAVLDRGNPRHAVSEGVHNFLTRDGTPPAELRVQAWAQMEAYPSVVRYDAHVEALERDGDRWVAVGADGARWVGRALLLATGVVDQHPDLPGYKERWGRSIHHCPYCHGWELRDVPLALMAHGEHAGHMAPLLRGWSEDVVVLTGGGALPDEVRAQLEQAKIPVYASPVVALEGPGDALECVRLADGTALARRGLFVAPDQRQVELVQALGVGLDEDGYVKIDPFGATDLPMVWAAGDLTTRFQQVVEASSLGARAAGGINAALTLGLG